MEKRGYTMKHVRCALGAGFSGDKQECRQVGNGALEEIKGQQLKRRSCPLRQESQRGRLIDSAFSLLGDDSFCGMKEEKESMIMGSYRSIFMHMHIILRLT